jgi:cobalt/nickel transport system permease protein
VAHIPDGVLSLPVLATGAVVTVAGCAIGLKSLDHDRIPQTAVLSAVFFIASLVHFPVGPSSVHLILNGLVGVMLGWAAFPAILIALFLQAIMFGFGGLVVLGVNVANMAVPAVVCGLAFLAVARRTGPRGTIVAAGVAGAAGVLMTALMVALSLAFSGKEFLEAARLVVLAHIPVMVIEAAFTAAAVGLLARVKPEVLGLPQMVEAHA